MKLMFTLALVIMVTKVNSARKVCTELLLKLFQGVYNLNRQTFMYLFHPYMITIKIYNFDLKDHVK